MQKERKHMLYKWGCLPKDKYWRRYQKLNTLMKLKYHIPNKDKKIQIKSDIQLLGCLVVIIASLFWFISEFSLINTIIECLLILALVIVIHSICKYATKHDYQSLGNVQLLMRKQATKYWDCEPSKVFILGHKAMLGMQPFPIIRFTNVKFHPALGTYKLK